ncbi:MAG: glycosyl hydrolase family 65 protein [Solirubrobacteraceae bacterium]
MTRLAFGLCFRERRLRVEAKHHRARYSLPEGPPLQITHHDQAITVSAEKPVSCPIPEAKAGTAPMQPAGRSPAWRQPRMRRAIVVDTRRKNTGVTAR